MTGEKPFETEIEPRAVTRREPIEVRCYMVSENDDIDITNTVPFNRATFWTTKHITGLEIGVDTFSYLDAIAR